MVVFAADQETEAVRAAMDIQRAISSNPAVDLKVGVGVHSGEAVVGSIGAEDRRDYTAIGDTINIGARICGACPRDSVYISAAVFERLPPRLQSRFSGHEMLKLKGKSEAFGVHYVALGAEKQMGE